jgi:4-amino-4-deoxy-L-arabinose transferase-like glycosyltransferase
MKLASLFHRANIAVFGERSAKQEMRLLYTVFTLWAAGILVYSQTLAFHWDEGFHILAADLINAGKRPYIDFLFAQTPLNAYWNAGWMRLFGANWRVVHMVAALATIGSVLLIVQYVFALFHDRRWQMAAALAALALFGLHSLVWDYGTISQAYPLCLFLIVAAFRTAIAAVARTGFTLSALAGFLAGAGAASSLLTAPASAVLLIWIWLYNQLGNRWVKAAAFVAGAVASCIPLLLLFVQGPHQVIFDILKYHSIYRRLNWVESTSHDIGIVTDWVNSSPSLLLVMLAAAGLFFIKKSEGDAGRRAEFRLCLWLILAVGAQNLFARPTFPQYFVFLIPFLTVLGIMGFYDMAARFDNSDRPQRPVLVLLCVTSLCLGNSLYGERDSYTWHQLERVVNKVKEVTPKDAQILAPEHIYFLLHWPVPPGLEYEDMRKLQFSPAENATLHILPKAEVDQRLKSGVFPTTVVCDDDAAISELDDWKVYLHKVDFNECTVFWQLDKKTTQHQPEN